MRSRTLREAGVEVLGAEAATEGVLDQQLTARVEHQHGRADEGRERARQRLEAALERTSTLESLLGRGARGAGPRTAR